MAGLFWIFEVEEGDTPETLLARQLEPERELYVRAIKLYLSGKLKVEGKKVRILD